MSKATVYVTVSGLTGSGKSAVMGEIEIALKALGIPVEHDAEFQSEKNMTHADWQEALDLYKPTVVLKEVNDTSAPQSFTVTDQMVEKACAVLTTAGLKTSPLQIKKIRRALEAALSPSTPS